MITFYGWLLQKMGFKKKFGSYGEPKDKENDLTVNFALRHILGVCSYLGMVGFFIHGAWHANDSADSKYCRMKTIAEVTITLPYAIGCNLFKERFDVRLN